MAGPAIAPIPTTAEVRAQRLAAFRVRERGNHHAHPAALHHAGANALEHAHDNQHLKAGGESAAPSDARTKIAVPVR